MTLGHLGSSHFTLRGRLPPKFNQSLDDFGVFFKVFQNRKCIARKG